MTAPTVDPAQALPFADRVAYDEAVTTATAAAAAYYDSDALTMDDATYDALVARIKVTEAANPAWGASEVTTSVAAGASAGGDVTHSIPMLSLDNVFDDGELAGWFDRLTAAAGRPVSRFTVEPKLDGLAVAARYEHGQLTLIATRGDGRTGEDVTRVASTAAGLPRTLTEPVTLEVRGEVYMTDEDFEVANENRVDAGHAPFVNPRNAAAGTVRNQNRTYDAPLTFAAYQLVGHPAAEDRPYDEMMGWLADLGFATAGGRIGGLKVATDVTGLLAAVEDLAALRPTLGFAIDGAVIKAALPEDRAEAGSNSRAPRWGIAWKYPADTAMTRLLGIEIEPGRTGLLSPRAVLEPVFVGGTTITSATLHNPGEIARLDLRIGDTVFVHRAGEVIPRVTGPNLTLRPDGTVPWEPPSACPRCGSGIDRSEKRWRCEQGRHCNALPALRYWTSRDCLDIEGAGETLLRKLLDEGLVTDVADLYTLTVEQIAGLDRMGETSATNVIDQIERSKTQPLHRVFCGLGVRYTGRSMSRRLAKAFGTLDAIRSASVDDLAAVEGVGPVRAESIVAELAELAELIDRLVAAGVNTVEPTTEQVATGDLPFTGKTVVVSGTVPGLTRNEANEWVERLGGKSTSSVSAKTGLAILGPGSGSKAAKAEKLGIEVMDSGDFATLVDTYRNT